jgi:tRNA uridine 5-carboxymethylaminomethyl modification enzyme
MGVLVDDLVTRGTREPYRMFTSRAEYRLMLREDNADLRLMEIGHDLGLVDAAACRDVSRRKGRIAAEIQRLKNTVVKPGPAVNAFLERAGTPPITSGATMEQLLKRAQLDYGAVETLAPGPQPVEPRVAQQVEIEIKYEGYIQKQQKEIEKFKDFEQRPIPPGLAYDQIHGLSTELRQKLSAIRPTSLGQASRIDGMTPAAISVLRIAITAAGGRPGPAAS